LSLAHALKTINPKCKIIYIGLKGEKVEGLQSRYQVFDQVCFVPAGKFRRYHGQSLVAHLADVKTLSLNTRDLFRVVRGLHAAEKLIKQIKPDVVFSKGGYVAVPVGIAAQLHRIPIITHDSDSVPGLANRIIGRWAKVHATGMPASYYKYPPDSLAYIGTPVDERIKPVTPNMQASYKKQLGVPVNEPLLLAAGGGQGAQQINDLMLAAVPELLAANPKLHVVHIVGIGMAGQMSEQRIKETYAKVLPEKDLKRLTTLGFTSDFYQYSGAADLIITRAGASAMAEFAMQAKACVVVPSSVLAGGHQIKNAQALKDAGAAEVLPADTSTEQLLRVTSSLLKKPARRSELAAKLSSMAKPGAARDLASIILDWVENHQP
jgi:UDP-N-acetylglucosamine--N-acetylmuramyl-(pentapeptide) pyrophosphoryl-undecaprenol N-acetylglucosamine transferase